MTGDVLRTHLLELLQGGSAHLPPEAILRDMPPEKRSIRPAELPRSAWELLEHLRLTQADLLNFCTNPDYAEPDWPDEYWPHSRKPPTDDAWAESVEQFLGDLDAVQRLVSDPSWALYERIPHGNGQTYLREVLLVADHNAYHLGQMVTLRRLLDAWPP